MSDRDRIIEFLQADRANVVVKALDEFSHVAGIYGWSTDGRGPDVAEVTLRGLVEEGVLLPAPRLSPERWYVHAQA